jgi:hypothetical protein
MGPLDQEYSQNATFVSWGLVMMNNQLNLFALEKKLISWDELERRFDELPEYCQKVMCMTPDEFGGSLGIGWDDKLGWFVIGTAGQGPFFDWAEKF